MGMDSEKGYYEHLAEKVMQRSKQCYWLNKQKQLAKYILY